MLGESPLWHPDEKRFYWTDMRRKRIFSLTLPKDGSPPTDKDVRAHALRNQVSGMAPKKGGGMITSFYTKGFGTIDIDAKGKATERLFGLAPEMGPGSTVVNNDAKCSPEGRYFAGQKELRSYDVNPP